MSGRAGGEAAHGEEQLPAGRVAVIGPGRLGTVLAAGLERGGHRVVAAGGGGEASRRRFRDRFPGSATFAEPARAAVDVDLVVIATPDDALEPVVTALAAADAVGSGQKVVHVAGALGLSPLRRAELAGAHVAACHPAQTVPSADADPEILAGAAWAVTARQRDRGWAEWFVRTLGGVPHLVSDGRRVLYHAGLVIGSNAAGAVVAAARQLLLAARVDDPAAFLGPLVRASVDNALRDGAAAITGPVVRADTGTVRRHLEELDAILPAHAATYRALAEVVLAQVAPALGPEGVRAVRSALEPVAAPPRPAGA